MPCLWNMKAQKWGGGVNLSDSVSHTKTMTNAQYIAGGVVSIFASFGIGQAIQGRWSESGWIFTVGQAIVVGGIVTTSVVLVDSITSKKFSTGALVGYGLFGLAGFALWIWELVDTWSLPSHYKIAQEPKFQVSPIYTAHYRDMNTGGLGLSFKYNF